MVARSPGGPGWCIMRQTRQGRAGRRCFMADKIRRVDYYYVQVADKPGEGVRVLGKLKEAGVNLLAFTAFPVEAGKAQIDLVAENGDLLARTAKSAGLALSARKQAFYVQGKDRVGAVADTF